MNMAPEQVLQISKGDTEIAALISLLLASRFLTIDRPV